MNIPLSIQITDKDTLRWIVKEQLRRQQSSATRTANDLIRERLTQLDMIRRDCDPCYEKLANRHGGAGDVTPAECEPIPVFDDPVAVPEDGGAG